MCQKQNGNHNNYLDNYNHDYQDYPCNHHHHRKHLRHPLSAGGLRQADAVESLGRVFLCHPQVGWVLTTGIYRHTWIALVRWKTVVCCYCCLNLEYNRQVQKAILGYIESGAHWLSQAWDISIKSRWRKKKKNLGCCRRLCCPFSTCHENSIPIHEDQERKTCEAAAVDLFSPESHRERLQWPGSEAAHREAGTWSGQAGQAGHNFSQINCDEI